MDLKTIAEKAKSAKPWFVPKWIWNLVVSHVCDNAKTLCKVDVAADFVSSRMLDAIAAAVADKDAEKRKKFCAVISEAGNACAVASDAIADGQVSDDEKIAVGKAASQCVYTLVSQEEIDVFIEDVRRAFSL